MNYLARYGKSYLTKAEFEARLSLFREAKEKIEARNAMDLPYKLGLNKFADWSKEEYRRLLGYKKNTAYGEFFGGEETLPEPEIKVLQEGDLPKNVDWRKHNAVNEV